MKTKSTTALRQTIEVGIFALQNDRSLISLGEVDGLPKAAGFNGVAAL